MQSFFFYTWFIFSWFIVTCSISSTVRIWDICIVSIGILWRGSRVSFPRSKFVVISQMEVYILWCMFPFYLHVFQILLLIVNSAMLIPLNFKFYLKGILAMNLDIRDYRISNCNGLNLDHIVASLGFMLTVLRLSLGLHHSWYSCHGLKSLCQESSDSRELQTHASCPVPLAHHHSFFSAWLVASTDSSLVGWASQPGLANRAATQSCQLKLTNLGHWPRPATHSQSERLPSPFYCGCTAFPYTPNINFLPTHFPPSYHSVNILSTQLFPFLILHCYSSIYPLINCHFSVGIFHST